MSDTKKARLVPYDMVSPGFEAVYVDDEEPWPSDPGEDSPTAVFTDEAGNVMKRWAVWTWTWPDQSDKWNDEIRHINEMQAHLEPLDGNARQIRAHIGSMVLCDSGVPQSPLMSCLTPSAEASCPNPRFTTGAGLATCGGKHEVRSPVRWSPCESYTPF